MFAFMNLYNEGDSFFIGAVLVTDVRGLPMEFRCTQPIKPTNLQKSLYGKNLIRYIALELCGNQLINSLSLKKDLKFIVTGNMDMVWIRRADGCPVVYLRTMGNDSESDVETGQRNKILSTVIEDFVVYAHPSYPNDMEEAKAYIRLLSQSFDITDPFDRIAKAVKVLIQEDPRFK